MINGVTKVIMTKADVLDNFENLQVCTAYNIDGTESQEIPFQMTRHKIVPVLKEFKGWNTQTSTIKEFSAVPASMKTYIEFINKYIGASVSHISNGPGRDQLITVA